MVDATSQLTENDVVNAVALHLEANGWTIVQVLTTAERGVDLVAERNGVRLHVEAKGSTSSKDTSRRYGKGFTRGQIFDHVAKAVHTTLAVVARGNGTRAALAVPDDQGHRHFVGMVSSVLAGLGVATFFVKGPGVVRVEGGHE